MINEPIQLENEYFILSSKLVEKIRKTNLLKKEKLVIGICGESGSGKSVTAKCLQIELEKSGISSIILHQDSYYKFPPKENHNKRKEDVSWIGTNEVKIDLMQSHINQFKAKNTSLSVPIVDYEKNTFLQYEANVKDKIVLIIEGVYSFLLNEFDYRIFMARTFKETIEKRKKRSREVYDPFVEQVLQIEHEIILPFKKLANVIIASDYSIVEEKETS